MRSQIARLVVVSLALPSSLFADFQYTETTKVTGGSMMGMMKLAGTFSKQAREINAPVVHSVYVQKDRMARNDPTSSEIIDLEKETVTHIDHVKKTYYVETFEQMKEQLLAAQRQAAQQPTPKPQAAAQPVPDTTNAPQLQFDMKVRNTGAAKQYSGLNTSEAILSMTLKATDQQTGQSGSFAMTNDVWLTPEIPGYKQVSEFYMRYGLKLGEVFGTALMNMTMPKMPAMPRQGGQAPPIGSAQGFAEMAKELSKMKGVPIYTVMRMGATTDGKPLPAASEAPLPDSDQNAQNTPSAGDAAKQGAGNAGASAIASKLGGLGGMLGGFGRKKQDPPPAAANDNGGAPPPQPTSMVLMETTMEMGGFSTAPIDASHFMPPAGYTRVEMPGLNRQ